MATEDMILDIDRFATLDVPNTISENENDEGPPIVQIVDPSSEYSYQNIKAVKSIIGSALMLKGKRKHLFISNLNVGLDYKTTQFEYQLK